MNRHNKDGLSPRDIDGWLDVGVDDAKAAARNRQMVANGEMSDAYEDFECMPIDKLMKLIYGETYVGVLDEQESIELEKGLKNG